MYLKTIAVLATASGGLLMGSLQASAYDPDKPEKPEPPQKCWMQNKCFTYPKLCWKTSDHNYPKRVPCGVVSVCNKVQTCT